MSKDPYVYAGTDVLENLANIRNKDALDKFETDLAIIEIDHLKKENFEIRSIFDFLKIHKIIFSDVYSWAGELRTIDIYKAEPILGGKSIDYVFASYLKTALEELDNEFQEVKWSQISSREKLEKITYFISEFWHIHPFREGNTRTTAMALYFLIKKANLHVNIDFLNQNGKYFRNALVLSSLYTDKKANYLMGIISDCVSCKDINKNKYVSIDGFEVAKYHYQLHTVNKLATINTPDDWIKK